MPIHAYSCLFYPILSDSQRFTPLPNAWPGAVVGTLQGIASQVSMSSSPFSIRWNQRVLRRYPTSRVRSVQAKALRPWTQSPSKRATVDCDTFPTSKHPVHYTYSPALMLTRPK